MSTKDCGGISDEMLSAVDITCPPVVVSLDLGASYCGTAFALKSNFDTIKWGMATTETPTRKKIPSALLYLSNEQWKFGDEALSYYNELLMATEVGVSPSADLYKKFTLPSLLWNAKQDRLDELTVMSENGKPRRVLSLYIQLLRFLMNQTVSQIRLAWQELPENESKILNASTEIRWVITIPAAYGDSCKAFLRMAAHQAGMIESVNSANLVLVVEPIATALAARDSSLGVGVLDLGNRFLLLDCGGHTVKLTTLEVRAKEPLQLIPNSETACGNWGGETVNANFRTFLREFLGPTLFTERELPFEFYTIYCEFENIKVTFNGASTPGFLRLMEVLENRRQLVELAAVWNTAHSDKTILDSSIQERGFLAMSKELMLSFFEPSLAAIVAETRRMLSTCPGIRHIVPVGGYAASMLLKARLISEFHGNGGVEVGVCNGAFSAQGAVLQGGIHCGLFQHKLAAAAVVAGAVVASAPESRSSLLERENVLLHAVLQSKREALQRSEAELAAVRAELATLKAERSTLKHAAPAPVSVPVPAVSGEGVQRDELAALRQEMAADREMYDRMQAEMFHLQQELVRLAGDNATDQQQRSEALARVSALEVELNRERAIFGALREVAPDSSQNVTAAARDY